MQLRFFPFLIISALLLSACKEEKKSIDPLSYLKLIEVIDSNKEIEHSRTQLVSLKTSGNLTTIVLAFAMDSNIPKTANGSSNNAYGIRFTLQDSLLRSKRLGGGTFVLKFKKVGSKYSIQNFKKASPIIVRFPDYSINSMDTIVNPEIVDIKDGKTNTCILQGCNGSLTPLKERVYSIAITFKNISGDVWAVDHGYLNELETTKQPTKVINSTGSGIKIEFPGTNQKGSIPNYDLSKLGTI